MTSSAVCTHCGAPLHARALEGLCPTCVGRRILRAEAPPDDISGEEPEDAGADSGDATKANSVECAWPRIAGFRVVRQLGEGGFGIVYLAEQVIPVKRQVALKVVKPGMDTRQVVARFEAERQALALMNHPGIARVFAAGATEAGRPYFVMEFVEGLHITQYADRKRLTIAQRLELFMQVCEAVQHAHQKGVIHRDLKPSNILVSARDGPAVPKVIDFGLAKATEVELTEKTLITHFHQFLGTPAYMSPEQVRMGAVDVDTRSDVYSLGVLLYELLTGKPPFEGGPLLGSGIDELRRTICETDAPRPSTRLRQLPPNEQSQLAGFRDTEPPRLVSAIRGDLDWIVLKALEKDRVRRYESAGALAADVRRHVDYEPVAARPPSGWDAFQKLVRRNRTFFFSAFAAAIALVVGLGLATVMFFREREARQRAVQAEQTQSQLRREADGARELAQAKTEETRRQLVLLNVSTANKMVASGDYHAALLWFVEALRLDRGDPASEDIHRRRIASVQRFAPGLLHLGFLGKTVDRGDFSTDSRRVVGVAGGTASVWDLASGETLADRVPYSVDLYRRAEGDGTNDFAGEKNYFQAHSSLRKVPTGLAIDDIMTGREIGRLVAPTNRFKELKMTADGRRVLGIASDFSVYRWAWPESQPMEPPLRYPPMINRSMLSEDGQMFVALLGFLPANVGVWDFNSGKQVLLLKGPLGDIFDCQLSPDNKLLALASWEGMARVYDTSTGLPVGDALRHRRGVGRAQFSPDGQRLATASWDGTARLWNPTTGQPLSPWLHHAGYVPVVTFSPDGTKLLTGGQDETVRVWDIATNRVSGQALILRHQGPVMFARFAPDGTRVATGGRDGWVHVWDRGSGRVLVSTQLASSVSGGAFSPDGRQLAVGCINGEVRLLDSISGAKMVSFAGHTQEVRLVQFSRDGRRVLTGSHDGTARLWDRVTGQAVFPALRHKERVLDAEFSPDERRLVTASRDHTAQVWDATTGARVGKPLQHICWVYWASFSPDGKRVVTAASDITQLSRSAQVWDVETGKSIGPPMSHGDGVLYAAYSPDGRTIVTGGEDTMGFIWDATTGVAKTPPLRHAGYIWRILFSPDGRLLLTVSMDGTARIWDASSGEPVTPPLPHEGSVTSGEWSPDGRAVLTYSLDGTARVWDVSPASGSIAELQRMAELHSAHKLKLGLGIAPLSPGELLERWKLSRAR